MRSVRVAAVLASALLGLAGKAGGKGISIGGDAPSNEDAPSHGGGDGAPARALPEWATTIPEVDYSVAFMDLYHPDKEHRCALTADVFGKTCGMCRADCAILMSELADRVVPRGSADVVIVSPQYIPPLDDFHEGSLPPAERSEQYNRTVLLTDLPALGAGRYYLIHKQSRGPGLPNHASIPCPRTEVTEIGGGGGFVYSRGHSLFCDLLRRPDVIWVDVEMGNHDEEDDDVGHSIQGVTISPGEKTWQTLADDGAGAAAVAQRWANGGPKALVWFRGKCHAGPASQCVERQNGRLPCAKDQVAKAWGISMRGPNHVPYVAHPRHDLWMAFHDARPHSYGNLSGVDVEMRLGPDRGECPNVMPGPNFDGVDYLQRMLSTVFVFILHGDSRWNLRTAEVLSTGAIPVVVSDGMTLPFEQVIPWGEFAVRIPECVVATRHAATILQRLQLSLAEMKYRSEMAFAVYQTYFSTRERRVRSLMASVGRIRSDSSAPITGLDWRSGCPDAPLVGSPVRVVGLDSVSGGPSGGDPSGGGPAPAAGATGVAQSFDPSTSKYLVRLEGRSGASAEVLADPEQVEWHCPRKKCDDLLTAAKTGVLYK